MIDFFTTYGTDILAIIVALSGVATSIATLVKNIGLLKQFNALKKNTDEKIEITQNGIVEAFKTAKIPNEWKISISNQVDKKLEEWAEKFLTMFEEHERIRTELAIANSKILTYTAAFNKLSEEEKVVIEESIKQLSEKDRTIEV